MITKKLTLVLGDCQAVVEVEKQGDDFYIFTLSEYEVNTDKTNDEETQREVTSVIELFLGSDEINELIDSLRHLRSEGPLSFLNK
ncbi:hypothetical protein JUJ52_08635 [Virgibacillus sp. AGTR]|uniref:hypothetical protein n=1 Tax=unclassified Virgibacillus TaxID=2620237 RepID=UPI000EF453CA|nr:MULTISPECIES: hypothetical protein [unclassified Virgibacillus]MCC2250031.1 hypothetical protein [Virgibacillus sp. AGTR]QRZ17792.1 hypothetical protein JUJ52_18950 [Virgibacillus sp. AGTR]